MIRTRRFFRRWQNWLALAMVGAYLAVAIMAPIISPMSGTEPGIFQRVGRITDKIPRPPGEKAPLGSLPGDYDVFHALVWGTRSAVAFGISVAFISAAFGIIYGAVAGYAGGRVNAILMRITDAFLTFPVLAGVVFLQQLLVTAIVYLGGIYIPASNLGTLTPSSTGVVLFEPTQQTAIMTLLNFIDPLTFALIIFSWMQFARITNTMVITIKRKEFVQAAQALGASGLAVVSRHLIPNVISPSIVLAARDVGAVVILQATLTFIGIGGGSAWGTMLSMGRNWIIGPGGSVMTYWWTFLPVTLAIIFFGVAWNLLGDGLNDMLDVHMR
jgi:peptide/nickel transport system permease protein